MAAEPKKGATPPAARKPSSRMSTTRDSVRTADPLAAPAYFATMISVMATKSAVRIAFGESLPGSAKYNVAVAIDAKSAAGLIKSLEKVLKRQADMDDDVAEEIDE